jgi:putative transposase
VPGELLDRLGRRTAHRQVRAEGVAEAFTCARNPHFALRVDNGPEFISTALDRWAFQHGVALHFIQPGKPVQNAHVESFNGHFRDECLAQAHFPTLARARVEIELWRVDYNCERPHSSLRYLTPKTFGDHARRDLPPSAGAAAAFVGGEPRAPGQQATCNHVEQEMKIN